MLLLQELNQKKVQSNSQPVNKDWRNFVINFKENINSMPISKKWKEFVENIEHKELIKNEEAYDIMLKYKGRLLSTPEETTYTIHATDSRDIPTPEEIEVILAEKIKLVIVKNK